jgi:hypothetical protein
VLHRLDHAGDAEAGERRAAVSTPSTSMPMADSAW